MTSKVWKEYIKKHGEAPSDETDLLIFSKKSRKIQTLTLKQALRIYNKHKDKADDSAQKKSKKKRQKKENNGSKSKNKKKDSSSSKKKKEHKAKKKKKRSTDTDSKRKGNKGTKSSRNNKNKSSSTKKGKNKEKKQSKASKIIKNLSPSKYRRRRTSTDEHIKRQQLKTDETNKKMDEPLAEDAITHNANDNDEDHGDITADDDNVDIEANEHNNDDANDYDDDRKHNDFENGNANMNTNEMENNENANDNVRIQEAPSLDPVDAYDDSGVSHKSPLMSSALAMFQNLSSPKGGSENLLAPAQPTEKVKKKGKRYFDFREFASGAFSVVYKAKDKENEDEIVAVKKIHIGGSLLDGKYEPTTKEEGDNEVRILKLVNDHVNTCNMVDTYFDMKLGVNSGYVLCIVMQYMQCTLKERIESYGEEGDCIPYDLIKIYTFQICKAINYMHIKNVCHRDIKPENILVNAKTNEVQLCDFGCSLVLGTNEFNNDEEYKYEEKEDGYEPYVMSRFYRAPECILGNRHYDCTADIWSLGVVIGEMFLGMILFMGSSNKDQLREIIIKLGWPTKRQLLDMNPNIDKFDEIDGVYGLDEENALGESWSMIFCGVFDMEQAALDLISQLLLYSPQKRLPLVKCLEHEYFDQVESLMNKSNKKKKGNKKMKKEERVPSHLFQWNQKEIKYAKSMNVQLPM